MAIPARSFQYTISEYNNNKMYIYNIKNEFRNATSVLLMNFVNIQYFMSRLFVKLSQHNIVRINLHHISTRPCSTNTVYQGLYLGKRNPGSNIIGNYACTLQCVEIFFKANFIGSKVWAWNTCRLSKYCYSRFNFQTVKVVEVLKILKNLKRTSAAGYDNIPPSIVKDSAEELSKPLTYLINRCLKTSTFPQTEKIAKVTPVYKSGAHSSLDNYRPISVLTVFSKV